MTAPDLPGGIDPHGSLLERMGIEIVEASAGRVVGRMPVAGNTQPYGLLHGGASCVLAETLGSIGSALGAGPGFLVFGVELNASHQGAGPDGVVTGVATALHRGRTMATYEIAISDLQGRLLCT